MSLQNDYGHCPCLFGLHFPSPFPRYKRLGLETQPLELVLRLEQRPVGAFWASAVAGVRGQESRITQPSPLEGEGPFFLAFLPPPTHGQALLLPLLGQSSGHPGKLSQGPRTAARQLVSVTRLSPLSLCGLCLPQPRRDEGKGGWCWGRGFRGALPDSPGLSVAVEGAQAHDLGPGIVHGE